MFNEIIENIVLFNCWSMVVSLDNLNTSLKLYSSFGAIISKYIFDQTLDFTISFVSFIEHVIVYKHLFLKMAKIHLW